MDILKVFSMYDKTHSINIQGTIENPLFQANQIALLLGLKSINKQIMNFDSSLKGITESNTLGGVQKISFLTEKGLYRLICRSNKPIAQKFQDWIFDVIKEIRLTGEYKLKEQVKNSLQHLETNKQLILQQAKQNIHLKLLELYHLKNVVYICKLKDDSNDKYIIKIGSTQNIKERLSNISNNYGCIPLLLDMFECINHTKFEGWLRTNPSIKQLFFQTLKKNGTITRETFLVNDVDYNMIITLIKNEIKIFNQIEPTIEKLIELEDKKKINFELEYKKEEKTLEVLNKLDELKKQDNDKDATNQILSSENINIIETTHHLTTQINNINIELIKKRKHTRSPKVYQYDPESLELINIYDSIIDVIRNVNSSSPSALKVAAKANTIYKHYRWMLIDRNIIDSTTIIVPPTIKSTSQNIEYIAMINIKQTKIMEVFSSQKDAALSRNLAGYSTISRAIKQNSISSGHYWKLFYNCSEEMRSLYLENNSLPELFKKSSSITVSQIDPITNIEVVLHKSIADALLKCQLSRTTLKKCSLTNTVHNGYKWRINNHNLLTKG